jgi:hypothetical protein
MSVGYPGAVKNANEVKDPADEPLRVGAHAFPGNAGIRPCSTARQWIGHPALLIRADLDLCLT